MKHVHWYDDDPNMIDMTSGVLTKPIIVYGQPVLSTHEYRNDAAEVPVVYANKIMPVAQSGQSQQQAAPTHRLQLMYDKVNDVYRRMYGVRQRIRDLSQEMDDQLEETRQTNCQLDVVRTIVEQLRLETEDYDRQLKAFYDYERDHYRRQRFQHKQQQGRG